MDVLSDIDLNALPEAEQLTPPRAELGIQPPRSEGPRSGVHRACAVQERMPLGMRLAIGVAAVAVVVGSLAYSQLGGDTTAAINQIALPTVLASEVPMGEAVARLPEERHNPMAVCFNSLNVKTPEGDPIRLPLFDKAMQRPVSEPELGVCTSGKSGETCVGAMPAAASGGLSAPVVDAKQLTAAAITAVTGVETSPDDIVVRTSSGSIVGCERPMQSGWSSGSSTQVASAKPRVLTPAG